MLHLHFATQHNVTECKLVVNKTTESLVKFLMLLLLNMFLKHIQQPHGMTVVLYHFCFILAIFYLYLMYMRF